MDLDSSGLAGLLNGSALQGSIDIGDDGGVVIDFTPKSQKAGAGKFDENLADKLEDAALNAIAADLLEGIEADDTSRKEWMSSYEKAIRLLGLKIDEAGNGDTGVEGQASVYHPLLLEAVIRGQSNARGELLPSEGPVNVTIEGPATAQDNQDAELLEMLVNRYLTVKATEYYPDTDRMLFYVNFGGCAFKKVYRCPVRQRPVSESVYAQDLIVSQDVTDLTNVSRITYRIPMRKAMLKRLQLKGFYRWTDLMVPMEAPSGVDRAIREMEGISIQPGRPQDHTYTLYECYTEIDLPGFEHKKGGKLTGLPLPYIVTIEKDSRDILAIRRNWVEGDDEFAAKRLWVKYPYVPGLGFYDIGLAHILGNTTRALTALWRQLIDAGQFANFPGGAVLDTLARTDRLDMRVGPGQWYVLKSNGLPIQQQLMPLPYKEPSQALMAMAAAIEQDGMRLGGTAEIQIGEGVQNAPVGTTIALIEQANKTMSAVHKRQHAAQAEEFGLLQALFREDPASLLMPGDDIPVERVAQVLSKAKIVPAADPNVPGHMSRIMQGMALAQMALADPLGFNQKNVKERILNIIGIKDTDQLLVDHPPQPPGGQGQGQGPQSVFPPDPFKPQEIMQRGKSEGQRAQITALSKAADANLQRQKLDHDAQQKELDRESRERIAALGHQAAQDQLASQHGLGQEQNIIAAHGLGLKAAATPAGTENGTP